MSKIKTMAESDAFSQTVHICIDDAREPPDIHLMKRLICHIPIPELLPKHWEPKGEYVEVFSGKDHTYIEKLIKKSEVKSHINNGWRITRLSKVSPSMVYKKWSNVIIGLESSDEI